MGCELAAHLGAHLHAYACSGEAVMDGYFAAAEPLFSPARNLSIREYHHVTVAQVQHKLARRSAYGSGSRNCSCMDSFKAAMDLVGTAVDSVGVAIVAFGAAFATARFLLHTPPAGVDRYRSYRQNLGRAILLGLEFLVAGDIIRTVVVAPTLQNVLVLGVIVLIRTFLSMSLELELEGHWPWQRAASSDAK